MLLSLTNDQITSEQLLREAVERQEPTFAAPKQRIQDLEELKEFQSRKRTEFEGRIRYSRDSIIGMFVFVSHNLFAANICQLGSNTLNGKLNRMSSRGRSMR